MYRLLGVLTIALSLSFAVACSDDTTTTADKGPPTEAGVDAGVDGPKGDGLPPPTDGPVPSKIEKCGNPPLTPPAEGTCSYKKGTGQGVLILGNVLAPDKVYENGQVLISGKSIVCVGCDCSAEAAFANATQIECAKGVISPGLINLHDHLGWAEGTPSKYDAVYDHRHEWRKGQNGKPKLTTPANARATDGKLWGELRQLMAGSTSIMGSGSASGLMRNIDSSDNEGLTGKYGNAPTFPLGDSGGTTKTTTCDYASLPKAATVTGYSAYIPHVAEGINQAAHNEYSCLSGQGTGAVDVTLPNSTFIHAVALTAKDGLEMAQSGTAICWSPRSNVSLYGMTADVVMLKRMGIRITLGTDWTYSGSINLLRELACANYLNEKLYANAFSAEDFWHMVTDHAAEASGYGTEIGSLKKGFVADIAIFDGSSHAYHEAVTRGTVKEVALVLRGGKALYGDDAVVAGFGDAKCEAIDVCGAKRRVCVESELGVNLAALKKQISDARAAKNMSPVDPYDLFFCGGTPTNEPSCVPARPNKFTGTPSADDKDGDGVKDAQDNCPDVFNPPRPMNDNKQADSDGDNVGDECDPCPLEANVTNCKNTFDPNDRDGDTVPNATDNCPDVVNTDQKDTDNDKIGDACDPCPQQAGTCAFLIKELRDVGLNKQPSPGTTVKIAGVTVIGVRTKKSIGFYVREGKADYEAIFVYTATAPKDSAGTLLKVGDVVTVEGAYAVFNNTDQLEKTTAITITGSGADVTPVDVTSKDLEPGSTSAEMHESQLVRIKTATITGVVTGAAGDAYWATDDGNACTGTNPPCAQVGDFFYDGSVKDGKPAAAANDVFTSITGIINGYKDVHTLDVRDDADLVK